LKSSFRFLFGDKKKIHGLCVLILFNLVPHPNFLHQVYSGFFSFFLSFNPPRHNFFLFESSARKFLCFTENIRNDPGVKSGIYYGAKTN
jgi:hypothetical protein